MFTYILTVHHFIHILKEILREEIKILEEKVEHHPDVTRFAMENLQLRGLALIYFKVSLKRSFC
jgi:hypothetical protein